MFRLPILQTITVLFLIMALSCMALNINDSIIKENTLKRSNSNIIRNIPRKGQSNLQSYTLASTNSDWEPLKIYVSSEDLNNEERYCTLENQMRPNYQGKNVTCEKKHIVTSTMKNNLLNNMIPKAVKLHTDRLHVHHPWYPIKVRMPRTGNCGYFTVPSKHRNEGFSNANFILYLASGPSITFSEICTTDNNLKERPEIGVMNFEPERIDNTRYNIRVAAHEIAHTLGFTYNRMRAARMTEEIITVRKENWVSTVISSKTKEAAKKHFGCNDLQGMELEDEGKGLYSGSHWERRNAKDELMSMYVGTTGAALYTELTLAAFEDLKYYKADFSMAENMTWGKNAGCDFLNKKCMNNNTSKFPKMFCDSNTSSLQCTSDRFALGTCPLKWGIAALDIEGSKEELRKRYSTLDIFGPKDALTDRCPVITPSILTVCTTETNNIPGSLVGPMSRCLNGESIELINHSDNSPPVMDICANVKCENNKVYVQYKGDEDWQQCESGQSLQLKGTEFKQGNIKCPSYEEVCTDVEKLIVKKNIPIQETLTKSPSEEEQVPTYTDDNSETKKTEEIDNDVSQEVSHEENGYKGSDKRRNSSLRRRSNEDNMIKKENNHLNITSNISGTIPTHINNKENNGKNKDVSVEDKVSTNGDLNKNDVNNSNNIFIYEKN